MPDAAAAPPGSRRRRSAAERFSTLPFSLAVLGLLLEVLAWTCAALGVGPLRLCAAVAQVGGMLCAFALVLGAVGLLGFLLAGRLRRALRCGLALVLAVPGLLLAGVALPLG